MNSSDEKFYVNYEAKMKKEKIRLRNDINVIIRAIPGYIFLVIGICIFAWPIVIYPKHQIGIPGLLLVLLGSAMVSMVPFGLAIIFIDKAKKALGSFQKHMVGETFIFHDDAMEIQFRGDFDSYKVRRIYTFYRDKTNSESHIGYHKKSQYLNILNWPSDFVIYDDYEKGIVSEDSPSKEESDQVLGILEFHTTTGNEETDQKLLERIKEFAGSLYYEI